MTLAAHIEAPSVFGEPVLSPDGVLKTGKQKRYIERRSYPLNFTAQDLSIGYRDGLKINLPRQYDVDHQNQLVIRTELILSNLVEINVDHLLSVVDEHCSPEMRLVRTALTPEKEFNPYRRNTYGQEFDGLNLTIDYSISIPELRNYGGTVYFHDVDLLVSNLSLDRCPEHPYSEQGMLRTRAMDLQQQTGGRFGFSIEIIDNQGVIGDRYINIGGQVSRIAASTNYRKMDGVYVSWNHGVSGKLDLPDTQVRMYPPEEADVEFKLFRSYAEAIHYGNGDEARKKELAELEHRTALQKSKLAEEKVISDRKALELDQALKSLTHQHEALRVERDEILSRQSHTLEIEKQKIRDYYEGRSYERKDRSEVVKILPTIAMGIGALILAVKAFF